MIRKKKEGRRIETFKEVSVSPMWQPEYDHHACREGINPEDHGSELEVASLPREAKLYFPQGRRDILGGPEFSHTQKNRPRHGRHTPTPKRNLPTANLFLAEFTVDTAQMHALVSSTSSLERDVRNFLKSARQFYGLAREPARREMSQGDCGLNLYTKYEDIITGKSEDVDGMEVDIYLLLNRVSQHVKRIRSLLRTSEPELYEKDGEEDSKDEDGEQEEPIYFTTSERLREDDAIRDMTRVDIRSTRS